MFFVLQVKNPCRTHEQTEERTGHVSYNGHPCQFICRWLQNFLDKVKPFSL